MTTTTDGNPPRKFRVEVRHTCYATVEVWVDGNGMSPADKAAAVARALCDDEWHTVDTSVVALKRIDDR